MRTKAVSGGKLPSPPRPVKRAASRGELEPEAAETIAAAEGLEPLNPHPPKSDFDVKGLSRWTLAMVVAWIIWRDVDDVLDQYEPYRKATPFWFWQKYSAPQGTALPQPMAGYWLTANPPATLCDVGIYDACPSLETRDLSAKTMTFEQAKADLWRKALDGLVTAEAIEIETNRRVDIPAREWHPMQ